MCFSGEDMNILVIGLDNAGKSTIINRLKPDLCQSKEITPTQGISQPWLPFGKYYLRFRDMAGASNFRPMWQQYSDDLHGIIFVIDSSDTTRFSTAAAELAAILALPSVAGKSIPLLVFANKNDIEGSAPPEVISKELGIDNISNRPTMVKSVCAQFAKDLKVGLAWLVAKHM